MFKNTLTLRVLVELSEVVTLLLVDDSKNPSDGLSDGVADGLRDGEGVASLRDLDWRKGYVGGGR